MTIEPCPAATLLLLYYSELHYKIHTSATRYCVQAMCQVSSFHSNRKKKVLEVIVRSLCTYQSLFVSSHLQIKWPENYISTIQIFH